MAAKVDGRGTTTTPLLNSKQSANEPNFGRNILDTIFSVVQKFFSELSDRIFPPKQESPPRERNYTQLHAKWTAEEQSWRPSSSKTEPLTPEEEARNQRIRDADKDWHNHLHQQH